MRTDFIQGGLIAVLLFGASVSAQAQAVISDPRSPEGITVHGHAEIMLKPDIARLTVSVTTNAPHQADAARNNATQATALLKALKAAGIASDDIQTSGYTVQPQYEYPKDGKQVLNGYQVTNSMDVTIRNLDKIGAIIDKAVQSGATQIDGPNYDLANRSQGEGEALTAAIANARSKADLMAGAAGVSLGKLTSLTEDSAPRVVPLVFAREAMADAPSTPISTQKITVTADVTEIYALR